MAGDRYLDPEFEDTELPESPGLAALAHTAEQQASGWSASAVRRLGARRRRRRRAGIGAGALVLVVLAGGVAVGSNGSLFTQEPPVVATPSPSPSVTPSATPAGLTEAHLLQTSDVPRLNGTRRVEVAAPGSGRTLDAGALTPCVPEGGMAELAPLQTLNRDFRYVDDDPAVTPDPADPSSGQPTYYTEALRFADPDEAAAAVETYQRWLRSCPATLKAGGRTPVNPDATTVWTDVTVDAGPSQSGTIIGGFATLPPYRDADDTSENGWFESVGLTQFDEKVMVTVRLVYGNEDHVSLEQNGDPGTGLPPEPQFALVQAATERLGT